MLLFNVLIVNFYLKEVFELIESLKYLISQHYQTKTANELIFTLKFVAIKSIRMY